MSKGSPFCGFLPCFASTWTDSKTPKLVIDTFCLLATAYKKDFYFEKWRKENEQYCQPQSVGQEILFLPYCSEENERTSLIESNTEVMILVVAALVRPCSCARTSTIWVTFSAFFSSPLLVVLKKRVVSCWSITLRWLEKVEHDVRSAKKIGLGSDMVLSLSQTKELLLFFGSSKWLDGWLTDSLIDWCDIP